MSVLRPAALFTVMIVFATSLLAEEVKIKKEDVPQPALDAIEKLAPGNTFGSAKKLTGNDAKDRMVSYEINTMTAGKGVRFVVSPEGKLYERREGARLADAPAPVRTLIERASGGEPDLMVKIMFGGGKPFYRFRVTRSVAADGSISGERYLGQLVVVKNEDVPQPVRNTIEKLAPGSDYLATKLTGDKAKYEMAYEIRVKNGKFLIVSSEGKLYELWDLTVKLPDVPDPVRKTVELATKGGEREPDNLIKIMPTGGAPSYMFRLTRDVAEDGTVLPKQKED